MLSKAKSFTTLSVCLLLLFTLLGCPGGGGNAGAGGSTLQVTRPTTDAQGSSDFEFDDPGSFQGHIVVKIDFSGPVDRNSVVAGKTLFLDTPGDHQAGGTLNWTGNTSLTFTTTKVRKDLLTAQGGPDVGFTLILLGTDKGSGVIKATNGDALDGDKNGTAGGDYKRAFLLPG